MKMLQKDRLFILYLKKVLYLEIYFIFYIFCKY